MTILTLSGLTKTYGERRVLDEVTLSVAAGERVALLGHNGAGKSTLMKLVLGLIHPDGGTAAIAGHAPGSAVARALTAYLPENAAFHPAISGREQMRYYLRLRGQPVRLADEILEKVGLGDAAGRRIGTYSKGMRQRVGLAQALIGGPRLMILDEPTSGLDPVSRREFYALLDELAANGTAILLSSHALSELEARTDRMVILSQGRQVAEGTLADLRAEAALPLTVQITPQAGQGAALLDVFSDGRLVDQRVMLTCAPDEKLTVLERIAAHRSLIADFDVHAATLDDLYSHISGRAA